MTSLSYLSNKHTAEAGSVKPSPAHLTMPTSPNADLSMKSVASALPSPSLAIAAEHTSKPAHDIQSLTDVQLAAQFEFISEIGYGNWGSVWQCEQRQPNSGKVAIKLVHRNKTPATAARVRALWSEFKIVRAFKNDPHPNIVAFDNFVITPSYALIAMDYHPRLIPVELAEVRGRRYFKQLLSALHFLHRNGIAHNDIKPSNILLSEDDKPKLCDFGFAKKYDINPPPIVVASPDASRSSKLAAFFSNSSYGTPEYLSPERAKARFHDERLADIWSLGVTFYEASSNCIVGRTPFEADSSEEFLTKEALEVYYDRTLTRRFFGIQNISAEFADLIKQMVEPDHERRMESCKRASKHPFFGDIRKSRTHSLVASARTTPLPSPISPRVMPPVFSQSDLSTYDRLSRVPASPMILKAKPNVQSSPAVRKTPVKVYPNKDEIYSSPAPPMTEIANASARIASPKIERQSRAFGTPRSGNVDALAAHESPVSQRKIKPQPKSPKALKQLPAKIVGEPSPDMPFQANLIPIPAIESDAGSKKAFKHKQSTNSSKTSAVSLFRSSTRRSVTKFDKAMESNETLIKSMSVDPAVDVEQDMHIKMPSSRTSLGKLSQASPAADSKSNRIRARTTSLSEVVKKQRTNSVKASQLQHIPVHMPLSTEEHTMRPASHADGQEEEFLRPETPASRSFLRSPSPSSDGQQYRGFSFFDPSEEPRPSMQSTRSHFTIKSLLRAMSPQPDTLHLGGPANFSQDPTHTVQPEVRKTSLARRMFKLFRS